MWYMYNGDPSWGFGILGIILSIAFWIIIIWLIVALIGWMTRPDRREHMGMHHDGHMCHHEDSALKIVEERYAKGEINKEEFEQKKKDLMER